MADIGGFLTQKINKTVTSVITPGYQQTNLNMLMQQAQRAKTVNGNYLFDFLQPEGDPNYIKKYPVNKNKLEKLISKLSTTTSIMTTFTSLVTLARVKEFLPEHLMDLMYNYWSLADTGINYLTSIQNNDLAKQIGMSLLSDLTQNFQIGNITYNEIHAMSLNFFNALPLMGDIKNNGIRPLLSIPVNSLLPEDMLGIYSDLNYLDKLYGIFSNTNLADAFNLKVKNRVKSYSEQKVKALPLSIDYETEPVTLSDPLGFSVAEQFQNDIRTSYTDTLESIVREESVEYGLSEGDIQEILVELQTDAEENVDTAFEANLGLPSIGTTVQAVNTETYNSVVNVINTTFQTFNKNIISNLNINPSPTGQKPFDYLLNLKRNLDARDKFKQTNAYSDRFVEIDNYLKTVVKDGRISDSVLDELHIQLKDLLKDVE